MNEEQHIKQLPKGWKWVKLGEVVPRAGECHWQVGFGFAGLVGL